MRVVTAMFLAATLTGIGCGGGVETGAEVPETGAPAVGSEKDGAEPSDVRAMNCQYKVIWPSAGVYEKPSNASTLLKVKYAGDIVGGYCDWTYYNSTEGKTYLAVTTAAAEDDIGWMRRDALTKL